MSRLQDAGSAPAGLRGVVPPCITFFAQEGTVAAIKDSHGDPARIPSLQMLCPPDIAILYGEDYRGLEALLAGADGWTAGVANFMPRHAVERGGWLAPVISQQHAVTGSACFRWST
jgi:hypothetical protein